MRVKLGAKLLLVAVATVLGTLATILVGFFAGMAALGNGADVLVRSAIGSADVQIAVERGGGPEDIRNAVLKNRMDGQRIRVISRDGFVLVDTAALQEGQTVQLDEALNWLGRVVTDMGDASTTKVNVERLVVDNTLWGYYVATLPRPSEEQVRDSATATDNFGNIVIVSIVAFILMLIFPILFFGRHLVRPLRSLSEVVGRVANGDLQARTGIRRRDELGDLACDVDRMTAALLDARLKLEHAQHLRGRAVAAISHDLRAPLTAMLLHAHAIQKGVAEDSESLGVILERGTVLNQYVEELFELTMLEVSETPLELHLTELTEMVRQAVISGLPNLERSGMEVEVEIREEPIWVRLAPGKLERVLTNLLDNARKYAASGGWLGVTVLRQSTRVRVEVADRGPGISSEDRERIFDWFYRPAGRSTSANGTGLGLAIAREILHRMSGEIGLECPIDGGCRFWIELPLPADRQT